MGPHQCLQTLGGGIEIAFLVSHLSCSETWIIFIHLLGAQKSWVTRKKNSVPPPPSRSHTRQAMVRVGPATISVARKPVLYNLVGPRRRRGLLTRPWSRHSRGFRRSRLEGKEGSEGGQGKIWFTTGKRWMGQGEQGPMLRQTMTPGMALFSTAVFWSKYITKIAEKRGNLWKFF